jgi:hypothetical protein
MYNRSSGMYLLASIGYKKKRKIYEWFFAILFSKENVVASHKNLNNSTYDLLSKAGALHRMR